MSWSRGTPFLGCRALGVAVPTRGPLPAEPSVAGVAFCREQPTYEAMLDELCCLIRWDTTGTFCFCCWRKKIVLILISHRSAGSYFSQRKMLEEMFKLRMTPLCGAWFPCLLDLLCKAAAGSGERVGQGLLLPLLSIYQLLAPLGKS